MKKLFKSLRIQVVVVVLVGLAIVQATLLTNYFQFRELKIQDNRARYQELLTQMTLSMEASCSYMNDMLEQIAYSSEVQAYLENTDITYRRNHQEQVLSLLKTMSMLRDGIKDITVLDQAGNCVNLNGNIYQVQELAQEIPNKTQYYYTGLKKLRFSQAHTIDGLVVGEKVYSISDFTRKEPIGTVMISFNIPSIIHWAGNESTGNLPAMLLYDRNENLIYSTAPEGIETAYQHYFDAYSQLLTGETSNENEVYYVEEADLNMLGGKIVFLISRTETLSGLERLQKRMIIIETSSVIILSIIVFLLLRSVLNPLNQFMNWMSSLKQGDLRLMKRQIKLKGATEIEVMADQFNGMMQEINDLTHRLVNTTTKLYETEIGKQQAELEYMHSQINPHFLFNTLESIKGCAVEEGAKRTFKMVNSLGKIFRYSIRSGNMVRLQDEVIVANSYMYLQQIRFENRLTYYAQLEDGMADIIIPKMILQPLLENAVVHGMEENGASNIWLRGWITEETVILTVTDDGQGINEEEKEKLQAKMLDKENSTHIGISNVYNRLRYIYGDAYGLELMDMDHGFGVKIRIPIRFETIAASAQPEEGG